MFTIKLFDDEKGTVTCAMAEDFTFYKWDGEDGIGCIETHDGREDVVVAKGQRCYVVNDCGKTVFKVTEYGAN